MTDYLQAAMDLAEQGLEVLPLVPGGKAPACAHGKDDATRDPAQIREWWTRMPNANIGVRPTEGMAVIDIDPKHGGSLVQLGVLPETHTVRTGSGGLHLYFWLPEDNTYAVRGAVLGTKGIDVKSRTGYLVAPPSLHESGNRYYIENDAEVADLPEHLLPKVLHMPQEHPRGNRPAPSRAFPSSSLVRTVLQTDTGSRNNIFFWAMCRAYERGATPEQIEMLRAAAAEVGLTESEIDATARSAEVRTP